MIVAHILVPAPSGVILCVRAGLEKHVDKWKPARDLEAGERLVILPECTSL